MKRAVLLLALAACAPSGASAPRAGEASADAGEEQAAPAADAGSGLRVCMHDAKDLAPCVEDCDRRIVFSCTVLATRLERGEGVPRDLPRAERLYERACDLGDASSCTSAARMVLSGAGVPPSRAQQVELLARACRLGDGLACGVPARAYATGNGVTRDEACAAELWEHACTSGDPSACREIDAGDR